MNKRRAKRVPKHMRRGTDGSYIITVTPPHNPTKTTAGSPYYKSHAPHWMRLLYGLSQASLSFPVWPYTCLCPFLWPDCHNLGFLTRGVINTYSFASRFAWLWRFLFLFFPCFRFCFYYFSLFLYFYWPPWYYHHRQRGNVSRVFTTLTLAKCTGTTALLSDY